MLVFGDLDGSIMDEMSRLGVSDGNKEARKRFFRELPAYIGI